MAAAKTTADKIANAGNEALRDAMDTLRPPSRR